MMTRNPRTKKMGGPPIRTTSRGRREAAQETTPIATGMMSSTSGSLATPFVNKKVTPPIKTKVKTGLLGKGTGARRPTKMMIETRWCGPLLMTTPTGLGVRTLLLMTKV